MRTKTEYDKSRLLVPREGAPQTNANTRLIKCL